MESPFLVYSVILENRRYENTTRCFMGATALSNHPENFRGLVVNHMLTYSLVQVS
jgi:hypothetical protein